MNESRQVKNMICLTAMAAWLVFGAAAEADAGNRGAVQTGTTITLADAKNQRTTLAGDQIEELRASTVSLMPDDLLKDLTPRQLRDLFSYLQSDGPQAPVGN